MPGPFGYGSHPTKSSQIISIRSTLGLLSTVSKLFIIIEGEKNMFKFRLLNSEIECEWTWLITKMIEMGRNAETYQRGESRDHAKSER